MGISRIEQLIEDIYEFVESCRMQPLSTTKVVVPKDELYDLLDELRLRTPDEVKRYQKMIGNRDAIMQDAKEKSEIIALQAREKANELLNEHEITQQAYYQANEMIMLASGEAEKMKQDAINDSNQIRSGALAYSHDILMEIERILSITFDTSKNNYDSFIGALKGNLDMVKSNRGEINSQLYPKEGMYEDIDDSQASPGDSEDDSESDFDFDENTFLDNID